VIYTVYRNKNKLHGNSIHVDIDKPLLYHYKNYYRINTNHEEALEKNEIGTIVKNKTIIGVLLLPMLHECGYVKQNINTFYCIIQSNWMCNDLFTSSTKNIQYISGI
jgi:hypothetical protein